MKVQIPETEEDTTREKLELELLDLIEQVSEAKQANFLLKYQLQAKGLSGTFKELDSPTDYNLSPESQEILEMFKMQAARTMLMLQKEDFGQNLPQAKDDYYGDDNYSDEEVVDNNACVIMPRSDNLVDIALEVLQPIEPKGLDTQITGYNSSSYPRSCCTLETTRCVIL
jgi:hypothetical protein